ncbi:cytochrome C biogenesis protein [Prevotella sp. oral taxon 376]|uniref:cytochrome c biogenesis protein CcsA n=1 Tax=Prevotella sp. oral taxon 376 TaxID=712466 RepID=UPI000D1D81BE|nr:cytochrome c biogenesis protein CcsA [Prevotella sp. oral taxon 376]PTL32995.1 cytochrome C biogenesis protein [Prevotella sp. oral taxon 376]
MSLKKLLAALYILVILAMGTATIVEKYEGTGFVSTHFYGTWWFSLLWAALTACAVIYIARQRMRKWNLLLLHLSLVIILAGALLTRLTSFKGAMHLRMGETTNEYFESGESMMDRNAKKLPFHLRLNKFSVRYHEGTDAAADYISEITAIEGNDQTEGLVSMNNIFSYKGVRIYQSSYDEDGKGSVLAINSDPLGIPVTYLGYALLFFSLIWLLLDPKGTFRRLLRSELLKKGVLALLVGLATGYCLPSSATTTFPKETASHFGQIYMLYNGRVCQLQTYAYDFTRKLSGKSSYRGCSPEQVLTGFIFWGDEWSGEAIIRVKGGKLKDLLQLPDYISLNDLFIGGNYRLRQYVEEYYRDDLQDGLHKQAAELDEKVQLIMELRVGTPLRIFPQTTRGKTEWFAPNRKYPETVPPKDRLFMQNCLGNIYQEALVGNNRNVNTLVGHILNFQIRNAANRLPDENQVKAERLYNKVPFPTILFMANLTLGFLALFIAICRMTGNKLSRFLPPRRSSPILYGMLTLSFLALTLTLALRWIISGNIPMSNGYETMLTIAWFTLLLSLISYGKAHIVLVFGFLLSGFFLLVSHINQMNPAIGQMMPVLNSPLLSVHVSIIMMSYALLSLTFICGITAFALRITHHDRERFMQQQQALLVLSKIFLYPGVATLAFGIFIGAVWANISWGSYWSWDPKETWALITLMIYAVPLHAKSLSRLQRTQAYHLYMILAFMSIIITYFGVNYILGGMHSYA